MDLLWATSAGRKTQKRIEENGGVIEIEVKREEESHARKRERERGKGKENEKIGDVSGGAQKENVRLPGEKANASFSGIQRPAKSGLGRWRRCKAVLSPCRNPKNRFKQKRNEHRRC